MEYRIECQECEESSILVMDQEPEYCPNCGRRADADTLREPLDFDEDETDLDGC